VVLVEPAPLAEQERIALEDELLPLPASHPAPAGPMLLHVSKRFESVQALADCSLSVGHGRMLGFLGPNGAGKTTAMRAVFGLVQVDSGEVTWLGRPVGREERLRFGYMPEERGLYPRMAVREQLEYFARLHGLGAHAARGAAQKWLERLGLAERAEARVEELSHGNQQCAQLAAALVHEPELLVLDEPFAGLDPMAVIGIGLLGLTQLALVAGLAATLLATGVYDAPASLGGSVALVVPWFALGFALYAVAYAAAGALAAQQQDANSAGQPVTYTLLAAFFVGYATLTADAEGTLAHILTVFPATAPFVLPARSALVGVPLWEHVLALAVVVVSIYALIGFAGRVYGQGLLHAGSRLRSRTAWRFTQP
jgi:ABC-type branched-subunit amino acid transport system ATPase component